MCGKILKVINRGFNWRFRRLKIKSKYFQFGKRYTIITIISKSIHRTVFIFPLFFILFKESMSALLGAKIKPR
jgi:hypothetical protein